MHLRVADTLRAELFRHAPTQDGLLDEVEICERLGVSRTPVREALKLLTAEGLLVHRPRQGTAVVQLTRDDLEKLLPVASLLCVRCAAEAATAFDGRGPSSLAPRHAAMAHGLRARTGADAFACLQEIHGAIADLCGNRWLAQATRRVTGVLRLALSCRAGDDASRREEEFAQHRAIVDAIRARDPERAAAAVRLHFDSLRLLLGRR